MKLGIVYLKVFGLAILLYIIFILFILAKYTYDFYYSPGM